MTVIRPKCSQCSGSASGASSSTTTGASKPNTLPERETPDAGQANELLPNIIRRRLWIGGLSSSEIADIEQSAFPTNMKLSIHPSEHAHREPRYVWRCALPEAGGHSQLRLNTTRGYDIYIDFKTLVALPPTAEDKGTLSEDASSAEGISVVGWQAWMLSNNPPDGQAPEGRNLTIGGSLLYKDESRGSHINWLTRGGAGVYEIGI